MVEVVVQALGFGFDILVFIAPVVFVIIALSYLLSINQSDGFVTKRKAVVLSLVHSLVVTAIFFVITVTDTVAQAVGNYGEILAFTISALIITLSYLSWGIPNIIYGRCRECGHEVNLGRLYCGHCGSLITKNKKVGHQGAWLLFGYSMFVPLLATLFQFLSPYFLHLAPLSMSLVSVSLTPLPMFVGIIVGPFLYLFFAPVSMLSFGFSAVIRRVVARLSS
jgi:hypothetical protein